MRRRPVPIPEKITTADVLRIILGLMMIPLGIVIVVRTLSIAVTVTGIMVGAAFIAFGVHRTWVGVARYRLYRQNRGSAK